MSHCAPKNLDNNKRNAPRVLATDWPLVHNEDLYEEEQKQKLSSADVHNRQQTGKWSVNS